MSRDPKVAAGGASRAYFEGAWAIEAPWDIGGPQPDIVAAFEAGGVTGSVLDVGCGTGEHALFAAARGHRAVGIDYVPAAIEAARRKAAERSLSATFEALDVFDYAAADPFDTVIDVGLFHAFSDDDRIRYRDWLHRTLAPRGSLLLICFSDAQPGGGYPRRVTELELRDVFAVGFHLEELRPARYRTRLPDGTTWEGARAWFARVRRGEGPAVLASL